MNKYVILIFMMIITLLFSSCSYTEKSDKIDVENNGVYQVEEENSISSDENISEIETREPLKADMSSPLNTSYVIDGEKIVLVDGKFEKLIVPDSASKEIISIFSYNTNADIDNDGLEDYIILLTKDSGGSGTFYYVAIAKKTENGYIGSNAILIGDRIAPQSNIFLDGQIIVNYGKRMPWEDFSKSPSLMGSKYLVFENGELKETKREVLSIEEAQKLVLENIGDCTKNECDNIDVNILDGKDGAWFIETILDGLKDDSIRTIKKINNVNFIDEKWVFGGEFLKEFKCQKGRGQQNFASDFCL